MTKTMRFSKYRFVGPLMAIAAAGLLSAFASPTRADVLITFEKPTYTTGTLAGQDGWSTSPVPPRAKCIPPPRVVITWEAKRHAATRGCLASRPTSAPRSGRILWPNGHHFCGLLCIHRHLVPRWCGVGCIWDVQ